MKSAIKKLNPFRNGNVRSIIGGLRKYVLLVVLPLFFGALLLLIMWNITRGQIDDYGNLTTQYLKSEVASMFREAETAYSYLVNDERFIDGASAGSKSEFDQLAFCASIRKYTEQSIYIRNIYVLNSNLERIYSAEGYWKYTPYTSIIKSSELSSILTEDAEPGWHVTNTEDAVPYFIAMIPMPDSREDIVVIITMKMYPLLQFMYFIDAQGCVLFNPDGFITPLITNETNIDWYSDDSVSALLGTRVRCFYSYSGDYTYMVAVALEKYNAPLKLVLLVFGIYFGTIAVIGFIYVCIASGRERKRLEAMIEHLPPGSVTDPSYEGIIASIKKSLKQYQDDKDKYEDEIRSGNIRRILKRDQTRAFHDEVYIAAGLPPDATGYCVATLFTDDYSDMFFVDGDELHNIDLARIIFRSAFDEIAAGRVLIYGAGLGRYYSSIFCFQGQEEPMKLAISIIRDMMDFIERNYGLNICATVSSIVEHPNDINAAYQETERLRDFIQSVGIYVGIVTTQNLTDSTGDSFDGRYIKQLQILANTLNAAKYELIPLLTDNILKQYVSGLRRHYHIAQSRLTAVTVLLSEAVLSCGLPDIDLFAMSRSFLGAQSVSEVNAAAREVFPLLARCAEETSDADPVSRACEFIRDNGSNADLSIPAISEHIGVSPQHLTRLFRKRFGYTVAEYLHSYRIKLSKSLLSDTSLTVSAIAEKVGYNSTNTFVNNFRRFEGITPSNFREFSSRRNSGEHE